MFQTPAERRDADQRKTHIAFMKALGSSPQAIAKAESGTPYNVACTAKGQIYGAVAASDVKGITPGSPTYDAQGNIIGITLKDGTDVDIVAPVGFEDDSTTPVPAADPTSGPVPTNPPAPIAKQMRPLLVPSQSNPGTLRPATNAEMRRALEKMSPAEQKKAVNYLNGRS